MNFKEALDHAQFCRDSKLVDRFEKFLDDNRKKFEGRRTFTLHFDAPNLDDQAIKNMATYIAEGIDLISHFDLDYRTKIRRLLSASVSYYIENPTDENLQSAGDLSMTFYMYALGKDNENFRTGKIDHKKPALIGVF
jgi:hypothetical protein